MGNDTGRRAPENHPENHPETDPENRVFVLLQGPHGPFFAELAALLRKTGAEVWRVGFNAGDAAFWRDRARYLPFRAPQAAWPAFLEGLFTEKGVTDLVLYGDVRPVHASAIAAARAAGLRVHVFEEGYLRPYWATYERDGANGHSRLMEMTLDEMRAQLARRPDVPVPMPPAHWGDTMHHVFHGALYHGCVLLLNRAYPHFAAHRDLPVSREFLLYLRRLLLTPLHLADRWRATRRIRRGTFAYHLCLLQLEHDSAFRAHSPFPDMAAFLDVVLRGFAEGAPRHHHLVVKDHPLASGQTRTRRVLAELARDHGVTGRVHHVRGGKLAPLLDLARSAVTVNSTAGQQALWRGLPLKVFGRCVYDKPGFTSRQSLPAFFADPLRPDAAAYRVFRRYLLATSQLRGGFYSARGRRALLPEVVDRMLLDTDPYTALARRPDPAPDTASAAPRPHLRAVI